MDYFCLLITVAFQQLFGAQRFLRSKERESVKPVMLKMLINAHNCCLSTVM